jgi:hypothetical protein
VLEYWSVGKSKSPNINLNWSFHYSTTPSLQQTAVIGKEHLAPPGAAQKPGPQGPVSLFRGLKSKGYPAPFSCRRLAPTQDNVEPQIEQEESSVR